MRNKPLEGVIYGKLINDSMKQSGGAVSETDTVAVNSFNNGKAVKQNRKSGLGKENHDRRNEVRGREHPTRKNEARESQA